MVLWRTTTPIQRFLLKLDMLAKLSYCDRLGHRTTTKDVKDESHFWKAKAPIYISSRKLPTGDLETRARICNIRTFEYVGNARRFLLITSVRRSTGVMVSGILAVINWIVI